MTEELLLIENLLFKIYQQKISNYSIDQECKDYSGCNFTINNLNIKFRKAKITPTKTGQFVTLWRRNKDKKTEPFTVNDAFDFYLIATKEAINFGFFLFPKNILSEKNILSNNEKEGKRGFRVYPDWTETNNNQAKKTQAWQTKYFINCNDDENSLCEKIELLLNK